MRSLRALTVLAGFLVCHQAGAYHNLRLSAGTVLFVMAVALVTTAVEEDRSARDAAAPAPAPAPPPRPVVKPWPEWPSGDDFIVDINPPQPPSGPPEPPPGRLTDRSSLPETGGWWGSAAVLAVGTAPSGLPDGFGLFVVGVVVIGLVVAVGLLLRPDDTPVTERDDWQEGRGSDG
jgi:hypothetical protein